MKIRISILLACTLKIWCAAATDPYAALDTAIVMHDIAAVRSALTELEISRPANLERIIDARIFTLQPRGYAPSWSNAAYNKIIDVIHYPFGVEVARIPKGTASQERLSIIEQLKAFKERLAQRRR